MDKWFGIVAEKMAMPGSTHEEKNHLLYLTQKATLDSFLERGAISKAQYDKSLGDLREKMSETDHIED